jgi:hypothetical protein
LKNCLFFGQAPPENFREFSAENFAAARNFRRRPARLGGDRGSVRLTAATAAQRSPRVRPRRVQPKRQAQANPAQPAAKIPRPAGWLLFPFIRRPPRPPERRSGFGSVDMPRQPERPPKCQRRKKKTESAIVIALSVAGLNLSEKAAALVR